VQLRETPPIFLGPFPPGTSQWLSHQGCGTPLLAIIPITPKGLVTTLGILTGTLDAVTQSRAKPARFIELQSANGPRFESRLMAQTLANGGVKSMNFESMINP